MRSIILFLITIVFLFGCDSNVYNPAVHRKLDWYKAKVKVTMEDGSPCPESYINVLHAYRKFKSDENGIVLINVPLNLYPYNHSEYKDFKCTVYMDMKEPPTFLENEISLKRGTEYDLFYIYVFSDSLDR